MDTKNQMTIAKLITNAYALTDKETGVENIMDYDGFTLACEEVAFNIEQDWDAETTLYEFDDGSVIFCSSSLVYAYIDHLISK